MKTSSTASESTLEFNSRLLALRILLSPSLLPLLAGDDEL